MTLSALTNNITLNILHGVRRSDPPFSPSSPPLFCLVSWPVSPCPLLLGVTLSFTPIGYGCVGPLSHPGGVPALAAPLSAFCFSGAASARSCCRFRPSSLFRCLVPFRALPPWVRGVVGVKLPLLCLLVSLPLCCAPLCGWALLLVSCLFGVCRLPPCLSVLPLPPRLDLCGALVQSVRWSPPSGYLVASVTTWLPCYVLGVWQCFVVLTSLCLMAAKASGPVWGVLRPLHHVASAVRLLSLTTLRYSSL